MENGMVIIKGKLAFSSFYSAILVFLIVDIVTGDYYNIQKHLFFFLFVMGGWLILCLIGLLVNINVEKRFIKSLDKLFSQESISQWFYEYDPVGRLTAVTDGLGNTRRYSYNAANQLISSAANGEITKYTYDANGNLVQKGNTRYTYNALNLLESWTDGEYSESYSYNIYNCIPLLEVLIRYCIFKADVVICNQGMINS